MLTSSALPLTTLFRKFLPIFLVAGAFAIVPRANASFQLSFVYDTVTGATTATYSGSWASFEDSVSTTAMVTSAGINRSFFVRRNTNPTLYWDYAGGGNRGENVIETVGEDGGIIYNTSYMNYPWNLDYNVHPDEVSGATFGFTSTRRFAPLDYVAGTPLSGYMVFEGKNLASLGFSPEDINASGTLPAFSGNGGNDVHWSTSDVSAVPEPASFGLLIGTAALGFGLWRTRRRRSQTA